MQLRSEGWFLDAEVMIKAKQLGLSVLERNVMAQMREAGTSHVRPSTCLEFVGNLLKYRLNLVPQPKLASTDALSPRGVDFLHDSPQENLVSGVR
jgi:hypothetical protein